MFGWPGSLGTNALPSPSFTDSVVPVNGVVRIVRARLRVGDDVLGSALTGAAPPARNPPMTARKLTMRARCPERMEFNGTPLPVVCLCLPGFPLQDPDPESLIPGAPRVKDGLVGELLLAGAELAGCV